ncbi:trace amine-associated receptor 19t [Anaeramoeba flamelloides]|uniref:Trace amine-associated receptor 19t n=1 Tax=Anaeramoeba flamelloides TaxID=1746091 RepID=A0AAV7YIV0_9EUKA|nr:trace amine-associated receptor 19t [Anaeramoeba flamelloides]KAJ6247249.1 trace amine-associated receptor 19t [Anaeramoeba flamelloides]
MILELKHKVELGLHILNCIFWIITISGLGSYHSSVNEPIKLATFGSILTFILSFGRFIAIVTNKVTQKGDTMSLYVIVIALVINMSRVSDLWRPCHISRSVGQDCFDGILPYTTGTILQAIILFFFVIFLNFSSSKKQRDNYQEISGSNTGSKKKENVYGVKDVERDDLSSDNSENSENSKSSSSSEITSSSSINSDLNSPPEEKSDQKNEEAEEKNTTANEKEQDIVDMLDEQSKQIESDGEEKN